MMRSSLVAVFDGELVILTELSLGFGDPGVCLVHESSSHQFVFALNCFDCSSNSFESFFTREGPFFSSVYDGELTTWLESLSFSTASLLMFFSISFPLKLNLIPAMFTATRIKRTHVHSKVYCRFQ